MITMENWATKAVAKREKEKAAVSGQKEKAMAGAVLATLKDFCVQNEDFAQAVEQGGTFADCMKAVAKGVGNSISDLDAYKKAVQFYFQGAKVQMQLSIDLIGDAAKKRPDEEAGAKSVVLNLADFF